MFGYGSMYPIGLDLGGKTVRAVQVKSEGTSLAVRACASADINGGGDGNPDDAMVSAIRSTLANAPFSGKRASLHLPIDATFSIPVQFKRSASESDDALILKEAVKLLPFPLEEIIIDCASVRPVASDNDKTYQAVVVAVKKDELARYLSLAERCGLRIEVVDFTASALIRVHTHRFPLGSDPVMLLFVDSDESSVSAVTDEGIIAHRKIAWGTRKLTETIEANLDAGEGKQNAEFVLAEYGLKHDAAAADGQSGGGLPGDVCRTVHQILVPEVEKLMHEIHNLIAYVRASEPNTIFRELFCYGKSATIAGLDDFVRKRTGVATRPVNPFNNGLMPRGQDAADARHLASSALALGLAMRRLTWL